MKYVRAATIPAFVYAFGVFAVGFLLGTIRVLILAPKVGETAAVLAELPIMIAVSFVVAAWIARHWKIPDATLPRILMGAIAFVILFVLEAFVATVVFGSSLQFYGACFRAHYYSTSTYFFKK